MGTYIASVSPFEHELLNRVQERDEDAFRELFGRFQSRIYRTALRILKEEQAAQDALQETFLNIYRAAGRFRGDSKLGTWINRIAVNVCLEMLRKNKKYKYQTDEDVSEDTTLADHHVRDPYHRYQRKEVQERIEQALDRLGGKHQSVVKMHDLEGYTIREIAEQLNVAEGTIKSRLFYGREELKKHLSRN